MRLAGQFPADGAVTSNSPNPCELDVDFGTVVLGRSSVAVVQIANIGSGLLDLVPPAYAELKSGFSFTSGDQDASIEAGVLCAFSVEFKPSDAGPVSSAFTIQTDGLNPACPPSSDSYADVTVMLAGTGSTSP